MSSRAAEAVSITVDILGEPSEGIEVFGSIGTIRVDIHFPFDRLASTVCAYAESEMIMPTFTGGDGYSSPGWAQFP